MHALTTNMEFESGEAKSLFGAFNDEPFYAFLVNNFAGRKELEISLHTVRLLYMYYMSNRISTSDERGSSFMEFVCNVNEVVSVRDDEFNICEEKGLLDAYGIIRKLSTRNLILLYKTLEKISRGQSNNPIWHLLRIDTISATKFFNSLTTGSNVMSLSDYKSRCFSEGVRFGVEHENVIKSLVEFYVMHGRESVRGGLGLLIDPTSGLLGASIDACFGIDYTSKNMIKINSGSTIVEIKCRYKYLKDVNDAHVKKILEEGTEDSVIKFLMNHTTPAVVYQEHGIPRGGEFLLSEDVRFKNNKRKREGRVPVILKPYMDELILLNKGVISDVIVFDTKLIENTINETADTTSLKHDRDTELIDKRSKIDVTESIRGEEYGLSDECTPDLIDNISVYEKFRLKLPIYINPRHQYYFQALIQHYVLSQYYISDHCDPERINTNDLPSAKIVSAVLRHRSPEEIGKKLTVGGKGFDCEKVPLFIIVTPIFFHAKFTQDAVTTVINNWQRETRRDTGVPIWVRNAVSDYVASLVQKPLTP